MSGAEYPVKRGASPWDTIEHAYEIAPGIVRVSTPSHGGIWLSAQRIASLPAWALAVGSGYAPKPVWWEEDCEVVVPLYVFQDDCIASFKIPTLMDVVCHMQNSRKMLESLVLHSQPAIDAVKAKGYATHLPDWDAIDKAREFIAQPRHPRQLVGGAS